MKKLTCSLLTSLALVATSFAGHEVVSSKEYKQPVAPTGCFNDHELQLDVFGAYMDGNSPNHAGPIKDHAWGGGVGVNYFFTRWIGIGGDAYWVAGKHNTAGEVGAYNDQAVFHNVDGSVIFRFPIDRLCLAPYVYAGGGAAFDGYNWGLGFAGVGVEYRVVPNKIGIFADTRWNYYGTRFGHDDQNNFAVRAGVRLVF